MNTMVSNRKRPGGRLRDRITAGEPVIGATGAAARIIKPAGVAIGSPTVAMIGWRRPPEDARDRRGNSLDVYYPGEGRAME